ncbi:MAG: class I SAM-dependent methyltransferase, partial [Candidatus Omnitrophica bacterium]|nr:class I SAM-dependent methyltransferase [Candidatus Omnitrophota bacterium]
VNIGSGNLRLGKNVWNVDFAPYKNVDVIADAHDMPFRESSCDGIISDVLLEHVKASKQCVQEFFRMLKPEGLLYCCIPFIAPFHSAPSDYNRWTKEGVKELFQDFEIIELDVAAGPTSGFLWVFQEWLAILLSFNIKVLYECLVIVLMVLTFPLKYLDLILAKYSYASSIALSFYVLAKKAKKNALNPEPKNELEYAERF